MTTPLFYWTVLALCGLYVFWRGGAAERVGMGIVVVGSILTTLSASASLTVRFHSIEVGMFLVDVAVFVAFAALALFADRFWPLWVAGLQLVGTLSHTLVLASSQVVAWAYAVTQALWAYPILLIIVIGAARHHRRLKLSGADPSWTRSSVPPGLPTHPPGPTP
ncbi:hypothetical protein RCO27_09420 [Sphingosinicella sp. LHD-64]|uniref:hypothetical protein n=1 Tax=Sphingosinicella sp. LHD-64 TaxID=3072139 RepID=UPI00280F6EA0|nr:hypothetical protein [Sphingosinicella sp. LHD-64]MDQ8756448.1 hypothetical protein [Sphingosinicella sp. LHD-64]